MGKRGRGRGGSSASRPDDRDSKKRVGHEMSTGSNPGFDKYYRAQGLLSEEPGSGGGEGGESEWDVFMHSCRSPLPTTFRITSSRAASQAVNAHVKDVFVPHLSDVVYDGVKQQPPKVLEWYPDQLAWQLTSSKQVIRKSPEFAKFQQFLVHETDSGNISRQEAVSMIPPLLLEVEPHHFVLDCCAAPGSKTGQLLEALHARTIADGAHATSIPPGLLVANDSDAKRCHMLVHQSLNRIGSPNTMITNLDASAIPTIKMTVPGSEGKEGKPKTRALMFDRILCDVPCSGDGTMRKNSQIWNTWRPADGLGLHTLQLRILVRAIQMLKPGGRLVYSTCSFNPMENEAIISAALHRNPDMSLVDVSDKLPGLVRRPGLTTWKVFDRQLNELPSVGEQPSRAPGDKKSKPIAETCWPNGKEAENGLNRCLRLYPHLQDTGGFFVAVLEKARNARDVDSAASIDTATLAEPSLDVEEADAKNAEDDDEAALNATAGSSTKRPASPTLEEQDAAKKVKSEIDNGSMSGTSTPAPASVYGEEESHIVKATEGAGRPFNEEPYSFLSGEEEQIQICHDFFELSPSFPLRNLFVRNTEAKPLRSVYLTSPIIRDVIKQNDYARLRLVSCGVKIFARQDSGNNDTYRCKWRVLQDGLSVMDSYMGPRRKVKCALKDLRHLLEEMYPATESFEDSPFKESVKELENGSGICEIQAGDEAGGKLENSIILPLWKAPNSLCLMVEKLEKRALSLRIFGEDLSTAGFEKNKKAGKKGKHDKTEAPANDANPVETSAESQVADSVEMPADAPTS